MLARCMEDAQAMSRGMRWGDAPYIDDMVKRGTKKPPQPERMEAGVRLGENRNFNVPALDRQPAGTWERLAGRQQRKPLTRS
jgi:hypothetical protein